MNDFQNCCFDNYIVRKISLNKYSDTLSKFHENNLCSTEVLKNLHTHFK